MSFITLPVGSTIFFQDGATLNALSEHNRLPISISNNRIEQVQRMSNGTARKFFVADKISLSISWDMLPSRNTFTVDGKWGALDIKDFYDNTGKNTFRVYVMNGNGGNALYNTTMYFTNFSIDMVRRNAKPTPLSTPQELWNISISLEEV